MQEVRGLRHRWKNRLGMRGFEPGPGRRAGTGQVAAPMRAHRRRSWWALLVLGALLQGCFSSARLPPGAAAAAGTETGLVFGTIGVSAEARTIEFSSLQYRAVVGFRTQPSGEFLFHSPVGVAGTLLSPMFDTPVDFRDGAAKGTLFMARLPAGDYEVFQAVIEHAPMAGWGSHVYIHDAGAVAFRVEAGGATYLGQFLSHLRMGRDADGIPRVTGAYFVVSDRLQRDLRLLQSRGGSAAPDRVLDLAPRFMQVDNAALRSAPE